MHSSDINSRSMTVFILVAVGLLAAVNAGNWIADENYTPIAAILGALAGLCVIFGLGPNISVMIPICASLGGTIPFLSLPFSVRQLALLVATLVFIGAIIFKKKTGNATYEMIDFWIWMNALYLGSVFLRNPVGVNLLHSKLVGGKPYIDYILCITGYLILSRQTISVEKSHFIIKWIAIINIVVAFICTLEIFAPSLGGIFGKFYSEFNTSNDDAGMDAGSIGDQRLTPLQGAGTFLILYTVCKINPMRIFVRKNHGYLIALIAGVLMILLSGFRSGIFGVILLVAVAVLIREKSNGILKLIVIALCSTTVIILISYAPVRLPNTFQRALSFIPGGWDQGPVDIARGSSQWRYEIWQVVLTSDRFIRNKLWGDGYGFLGEELAMMEAANSGLRAAIVPECGLSSDQTTHAIQGTYHSGPVSTIKRVGYVGLVLVLVLLFAAARYAYQTIDYTRHTPFLYLALFFGIPAITLPTFFIFIFGDFNDTNSVILNIGILKMINNSRRDWSRNQRLQIS